MDKDWEARFHLAGPFRFHIPRWVQWLLLVFVSMLVMIVLWIWDGYQQWTVVGDSNGRAHAAYDSAAFQQKVDHALHERVDYAQSTVRSDGGPPKVYSRVTVHGNLVENDIGQQPGFDVPEGTRLKILFEADALPYKKVEFETGAFKGRVGWLSDASIDDPRTHWP